MSPEHAELRPIRRIPLHTSIFTPPIRRIPHAYCAVVRGAQHDQAPVESAARHGAHVIRVPLGLPLAASDDAFANATFFEMYIIAFANASSEAPSSVYANKWRTWKAGYAGEIREGVNYTKEDGLAATRECQAVENLEVARTCDMYNFFSSRLARGWSRRKRSRAPGS